MPDYSPTLGAIAQELSGIGARLALVEGKPALELTPSGFEVELGRVVRGAASAAGGELREVTRRAGAVTDELEALAAGQRDGLAMLEGWRFDQFGRDALDLVEGRLAFAVVNGKLKMTRAEV